MKQPLRILLAIVAALAGAVTAEFLSRMPVVHRAAGRIFHRGELIAMVDHRGIFQDDDVAEEVLRVAARGTRVDGEEVSRMMFALRGQFGDERGFKAALRRDGMWSWLLRNSVVDTLRGAEWLESQISAETGVSPAEARGFFDEHQAEFVQPPRVRPRHIFLAAPVGSNKIEIQRAGMQTVMARLQSGEDFAALAAAVSEDEATKARGGDLGFMTSERVPAEFWNAIKDLPLNGAPALVQSHLGFHAVQILDAKPAHTMTFEEALPEIEQQLGDAKRIVGVERQRAQLVVRAALVSR